MRNLRIATGESRLAKRIKKVTVTWAMLFERLTAVIRTDETFAEYMAMDRETQSAIKDRGYFIGGWFKSHFRRKAEMIGRSLVTLDVDHWDPWDDLGAHLAQLPLLQGITYAWHTTHKHSEESPRYRIVVALAADIKASEYEAFARMLASLIAPMEVWDDTTFQEARIMFWGTTASDGEHEAGGNEDGEMLDPDVVWAHYEDRTDFSTWPHSNRVPPINHATTEARDPREAPGYIGAFNRTYDIHQAIVAFGLPYAPTEWDNRYMPEGSSGGAGAIVYDDVFLYSWHEHDPGALQNLNAFDLVRIYECGEYTPEEIEENTPTSQRASVKAMLAIAAQDPDVKAEYDALNSAELDELDDLDEEEGEPQAERKKPKKLTYETVMADIRGMDDAGWEDIDMMLRPIAAARLDATKEDRLLHALRAVAPDPKQIRLTAMREDLDSIRRTLTADVADDEGELSDIEMKLVDQFLETQFNQGKHLRRIDRQWWLYHDGVWRMGSDEAIAGLLQASIARLREERPDDVMELVAAVGDSKTSALTAALNQMLVRRLAARVMTDSDPLKQTRKVDLPVVNCLNCELHFDVDGTMTRHAHNPEHFWTVQIQAEYDPEAECPEWDRFCSMIFSECLDPSEMQRHLEELGGYIIQLSRWLKTWVLFHGNTDTGKSTVLEVFATMLGPAYLGQSMGRYAGSRAGNFAEMALIGRLLLGDDDFDKEDHLPDGFIKRVSEEKILTAEIKNAGFLTFVARTLPIICANHWPVTKDVSDAFRDRALVFDFMHRIAGSERSDQRQAAMMAEMPGILNRFLAGITRLRARGHWDPPVDAIQAHHDWVGSSNPLHTFIAERLEQIGKGSVAASAVHADYQTWVKQAGSVSLGRNELFQRLDQIIGHRGKYQGIQGWTGWRIRPRDVEELDDNPDDDSI